MAVGKPLDRWWTFQEGQVHLRPVEMERVGDAIRPSRVRRFGVSGRYLFRPNERLERLVSTAVVPQLLPQAMRKMGLLPEAWDYKAVSDRQVTAPHWDDVQ